MLIRSSTDIPVQHSKFSSTYLSRKKGVGESIINSIMPIIREKLSGRRRLNTRAVLDASIAILSARLQLNLYPATVDARKYEEELIRNHLRMLYYDTMTYIQS